MESLQVHLEQGHGVLAGGGNVKKAESIIYTVQVCPFCLITPARTRHMFFSHVGRHLQEVSLAALPPSLFLDDDGELMENSESDETSRTADNEHKLQ